MSRSKGNSFERWAKAKAMLDFRKKKNTENLQRFKSGYLYKTILVLSFIIPCIWLLVFVDAQLEGTYSQDELAKFERYRSQKTRSFPTRRSYTSSGESTTFYLMLELKNHRPVEIIDNNRFTLPKENAAVVLEHSRILGLPKSLELVESEMTFAVNNNMFSRINLFILGIASLFSIALIVLSRRDLDITVFSYLTGSVNVIVLLKLIYYSGL